MRVVESEVEEMRGEWEEAQAAVQHHQDTIRKLTSRLVLVLSPTVPSPFSLSLSLSPLSSLLHPLYPSSHFFTRTLQLSSATSPQEQLQSDITSREARMAELEQLVSELQASQAGSVRGHQEVVRQLEEELASVRREREGVAEETERLHGQLSAASGNQKEMERVLSEEVREGGAMFLLSTVLALPSSHSCSEERTLWASCRRRTVHFRVNCRAFDMRLGRG